MGYYDDCLEHHGILGQKWGVRRFESASGHLTAAGKNRYSQINGEYQKLKKKVMPSKVESAGEKKKENTTEPEKKGLTDKQKKAIIVGAAVVGTALTAYGGYKLYQKGVQTRAHAHMLATGTSAVNKAISNMGKPKASTPPPVPKQDSSKALSNAKSALKEFQALQSNPNKPTFSKPAQNHRQTSQSKPKSSPSVATPVINAISKGNKSVSKTIKVSGQTKFNQAAQANDDLVQELLKKNTLRF